MDKIGFQPPIGEVRQLSQGEIPHTLTRLDWLELKLNSTLACHPSAGLNRGIVYSADAPKDTITISVYHGVNDRQELIEKLIETGQRFLSLHLHRMDGIG